MLLSVRCSCLVYLLKDTAHAECWPTVASAFHGISGLNYSSDKRENRSLENIKKIKLNKKLQSILPKCLDLPPVRQTAFIFVSLEHQNLSFQKSTDLGQGISQTSPKVKDKIIQVL